jgi:MscS family membrane protein
MADKPCRAGDRIVVDRYEVFVEDIGLRSTKLRLLDGHMVTLPNDQIAGRDVENVSRRTHIRRSATIHIPLDTPCDKVEAAVNIIRQKLASHERMEPDRPPKVFLEEFGMQAFCIRFYYWYTSANIWEFREFSSKLNIEIFREFEENGIQFSLPFRHSFWKHDAEQGPLDIRVIEGDKV